MSQKQNFNVMNLFENKEMVKICAPMVRYSKLQFRNLVKMYECDLTFTPMILADSFCKSESARKNEFRTNLDDTPVITQFAANTVHDFVGASYLVAPYCDGVDLNCGCPQRWAKDLELGCEMLNNPQKIYDIVKTCRNTILKPFTISVKTRIVKCKKRTVEICKNLEKCGVDFLSIHSRTKEQPNTTDINTDMLKLISENCDIPIVGNGGITNLENCRLLQEKTKIKGVMVANGILTNPTLFCGTEKTTLDCVQSWLDLCFNSTLNFDEFNKLQKNNIKVGYINQKPSNLTFQCFHHHLVFMLEKILTRSQKRIFNNLKNFGDVQTFIYENFNIRPNLFSYDEFIRKNIINVTYDDRSDVYDRLKPPDDIYVEDIFETYDSTNAEGKYFKNKVNDYSLTDFFIEND